MSSSAAEYYEVQWRPQGSNAAWSAPAKCSPLGSIAVKGLPRGTQYEFQVRAVSNCGAKSAWVGSNYTVPAAPPPRQPLMPTPTGKSDGVALDWGDGTVPSGDVMYQIDRAPAVAPYASTPPPEGDASWVRVATVSATNWTDSVTDTANYWYRVRAVSFTGATSPWTVLNAPAKAIISTPEVSAQVDQARADIIALGDQADTLRNDVDTTIAQVQTLQGQVGDILQADVWDGTKTYPLGDLVQYGGKLYRSLIDGNTGHEPTGATDANWEYIGNYASLGEAVGATAAQVAVIDNTVTQQGDDITANSQSIAQNAAAIGTKADASALNATNATVTQQGNAITATAQDVSLLGAHNADQSAFNLNSGTVKIDGGQTLAQTISGLQASDSALGARVDGEASARVDGDDANASSIISVQAQLGASNENLYPNPSGANGVGNWSKSASGMGDAFYYNGSGVGQFIIFITNGVNGWWQDTSLARPANPGPYVLSMDVIDTGAAPNTVQVGVNFINSANAVLQTFRVFDDKPGASAHRLTLPCVAPAGTVRYSIWVQQNNSGAPEIDVTRIKFERGTVATAFTDDATLGRTASATTQLTAGTNINGTAYAAATTMVDANGRIGGTRLASNGTVSSFDILADRFSISSPAGGARTEYSNGNWRVYDAAGTLRVAMGVNI